MLRMRIRRIMVRCVGISVYFGWVYQGNEYCIMRILWYSQNGNCREGVNVLMKGVVLKWL